MRGSRVRLPLLLCSCAAPASALRLTLAPAARAVRSPVRSTHCVPRALVSASGSAAGDAAGAAPAGAGVDEEATEVDVVVIGSGLAGLSCGALLASRGVRVSVVEAHYEIGGAAHSFCVGLDGKPVPTRRLAPGAQVFHFEAGPSLYSGLSPAGSPNPLKHVLQMVGEEVEWLTYDLWGAHLPEAPDGYELSIGERNFKEILKRYGGPTALSDWDALAVQLRPLSRGVMALPSTALRPDLGVLLTLGLKYPLPLLAVLKDGQRLTAPFDVEALGVTDAFLKNYLDLLAFLLQGLPASQTLTAVMAYMVEDFYREGAVMDFPKGGSGAIAEALARGVSKHEGCEVVRSRSVERVLVERGRAAGVRLRNGRTIRAARAVVSNADLHGTFALVPEGAHAGLDAERARLLGGDGVPLCKSFVHLHLGITAADWPEDLPPQWTVVRSWDEPIDAPGNVVVVSVPSLLDPGLAPPGHHVIHAYTAGNEPYELWEKFEGAGPERAEEYEAFKAERAKPVWEAIERRLPDVRRRCVVELTASPLTHARFLRRHRGNYGLAIAAGNEQGWTFPPVTTPLPGYYRCGDSTTSGIGVPAVAASGAQCANALISVWDQLDMNSKIRMG